MRTCGLAGIQSFLAGALLLGAVHVGPAGAAEELPAIVVQASAIPGNAIDIDKIPGDVQTLNAADLSRDGLELAPRQHQRQ